MLKKIGAIDFATTIAPGMRDVLLTGKVMEAATRERRGGGRLYDAVVLDAPPTGRIARFLNVNTEVAALARMGPVRNQADSVMRLLQSPKTAVHLVTVLEEMPVQETTDGVAELTAHRAAGGRGVRQHGARAAAARRTRSKPAAARQGRHAPRSRRGLKAAGLDADPAAVAALAGEAADHAGRVRARAAANAALLADLARPTYELPLIADADRPLRALRARRPAARRRDGADRGPTATKLRLDIDALLDDAEIIVCCGAGGVGKTTTAAALALRAAERGERSAS